MSTPIRVLMAQLNLLVGDIPGNTDRIIATALEARDEYQADLVLFPELALSGYPPEDLLLRPSLEGRIQQALERIKKEVGGITLVLGYPGYREGALYNMAGVIRDGELICEYAKQCLPNYQVFDEQRYFVAGDRAGVFECRDVRIGLSICEDIWHSAPAAQLAEADIDLVLSLNASPYHMGKEHQRLDILTQRARQVQAPVVYLNQVGGQDELVFDGSSLLVSAQGEALFQGDHCSEGLYTATFDAASGQLTPEQASAPALTLEASVYQALVLGVRDYVNKNGFPGVVLGLSGGIDSALSVAVAVDALGPERVEAIMMPFRWTSSMSLEDAEAEARALGIAYDVISIEPLYDSFMQQLRTQLDGYAPDTTEENLQARCRGVLLMAVSNKKGYLVLTTGNKSEIAVGYSTLYGDMAGGFDVLKDIPKTLVYRLSRYRNTLSPVIPQRVIDRPPSAELAPDQTDQDSLPDYDVLDRILELYVERDYSAQAIIDEGFAAADVNRVVRLVDINEYKRRQAPVGPRVTQRGFGRDRRYPITSGWKAGL
ncbi:NAD+ synthase [Marinobacterium marinum]|uniref:Glutamine-dependent NAD(+) synthetase n=1 Tax=Marinobacterium marinum TaxID=2756129 RepID=A0A7W1WVR0_9GAMM|nr:NAD+ synthase [Marinobacterium marinum]MBA4501114.1 NAD+ synthase [Marinobacterium marinum]